MNGRRETGEREKGRRSDTCDHIKGPGLDILAPCLSFLHVAIVLRQVRVRESNPLAKKYKGMLMTCVCQSAIDFAAAYDFLTDRPTCFGPERDKEGDRAEWEDGAGIRRGHLARVKLQDRKV